MKIGINTYGLSKCLLKDFNGTLEKLKEAGITAIEPMIVFSENEKSKEALEAYEEAKRMQMTGGAWPRWMADEKMQVIRDAGFQIRSVHMLGPGWKEPLLGQAIAFAKEQKLSYYVVSPNETSIERAKTEFAELQTAARKMKENGVELLIHNHETEMQEDDGSCVFDFLMETIPELRIELDVGWVKFAGRDCIEIMKQYRDRIRIIHFKDICEGASPENRSTCFTAIGEGSIPLVDILSEANQLDLDEVGYVIDQDGSLGDILRDAHVGADHLK